MEGTSATVLFDHIEWDDANIPHATRHGVSADEIEQALVNADTWRPNKAGARADEAERAQYYYDHRHDLDKVFGDTEPNPRQGQRLDVTISVRFTADEIAAVRARAEALGMKPTAYIRAMAVAAGGEPLDRARIAAQVQAVERELTALDHLVAERKAS